LNDFWDDSEHNPAVIRREDGTYTVEFIFPDIETMSKTGADSRREEAVSNRKA
jgi:hypothetical protein